MPQEKSPLSPKFDEVFAFRGTLTKETDRGVALVCAAYLDVELKALLTKTFVDSPKIVDGLFEHSGPLGTFSSRIDLAFALGLLPTDFHRALNLIRKIRNDFAHAHEPRHFSDTDISARCRELATVNTEGATKDPRKLYIRAVMALLAIIHAQTRMAQHSQIAPAPPLDNTRDFMKTLASKLAETFASLDEKRAANLLDVETRSAEEKRIILEVMTLAGLDFDEASPSENGPSAARKKGKRG